MTTYYEIRGERVARYEYELHDCASALHCHMTGACDPLPPEEVVFYYEFLKARLDDWHPSLPRWRWYEEAFREFIQAAVNEYERYGLPKDLEQLEERASTITPEEVEWSLEQSRRDVEKDLRPKLKKVFNAPPNVKLDKK